jgi:hypothetical protein
MFNFDAIGDFNPQLLRELKSRWSWRNGAIATAISGLAQGIVLLSFYSKLPTSANSSYPARDYCLTLVKEKCSIDALGNVLIDWTRWWGEVAIGISWVMFYGLFAGGVYLLASSFSQEEKRGTLDFIRLTPQKASRIFGGKLLGVPVLVYWATALAMPLQFHAAQGAGISRLYVLSWDLWMVAVAMLLYGGASLATLWFKAQSILLAAATLIVTYPVLYLSMVWIRTPTYFGAGSGWYNLPLRNSLPYYWIFAMLTCVGIYWLYKALERRYLKPKATVLSKGQSYLWSLLFHLFFAGFCFYNGQHFNAPFTFGTDNSYSDYGSMFSSALLAVFGTCWLLLLIPLLLPGRQSLVEWTRHRWQSGNELKSLIWSDKSPAVLAVALNVAIASLVWILLTATSPSFDDILTIIVGAVMTGMLAAIYSAIAHLSLFWKMSNRHAWSAGIIGGLIFLPVIGANFISLGTSLNPLYLLSPFLWIVIKGAEGWMILFAVVVLLVSLLFVMFRLNKVLKQVGRSESFQSVGSRKSAIQ